VSEHGRLNVPEERNRLNVPEGLGAALQPPRPVSEHDEPKTALTRLLGAHHPHFVKSAYPSWECSCGEWDGALGDNGSDTDGQQDTSEGHAAHLADVLLAEGYTTSPAPEATETVEWRGTCTHGAIEQVSGSLGVKPTCGDDAWLLMERRTVTSYADRVTEWVPVDRAADEHGEGEQ
jgi:hypothetical protein